MTRRFAWLILTAVLSLVALAGLAGVGMVTAQTETERTSFVVATGSTGGTYFPIGEALVNIVSHPPGVARCDVPGVCGPAGLIASARTSDGAVENVLDVNAHRVDAGLVQAGVVAQGVAGKGEFHKEGPQTHIRVIADLFPEQVHIVVAKRAHIESVEDLRGKRVSVGAPGSGTFETAKLLFAAYRIPERRIRETNDPSDVAVERLEKGEIDAFLFVGGAPVELVSNAVAHGDAALIPIDGAGRNRLLSENQSLASSVIPANAYPGAGETQTVAERAVWIVNDSISSDLVYGVTKALFNPANRELLDDSHPSAKLIRLQTATLSLPAPLHPGAAKFYRQAGIR